MIRRPPRSTRTDTLFPYTTLFRSIAVEAVAVLADRDVELELVVAVVGLRLAQVPRHARAAQHRPREAPVVGLLRAHHADVDSALAEDAVVGEQNLYVVDHLGEGVAEAQDVVDEAGRQVLVHTAGPEVGRVHARSADPLVELTQLLALFRSEIGRASGRERVCQYV